MTPRYMIENAMVGPETHYSETESGALWLARMLASGFAARLEIASGYSVFDLASTPPVRIRTVQWDPPYTWPIRPPWPLGWTYSEI